MMQSLKENIGLLFSNKRFLVILLIAAVFIVAAIYTYRNMIKPRMDNTLISNSEFNKGTHNVSSDAELYYFYTEWCPHCKKAKPIINKLKEQLSDNNNQVNDVNVHVIEVDCDKDAATADKFGVEGYPTIKLVHQNRIIEYDAKPEIDVLHEFLSSSLQ